MNVSVAIAPLTAAVITPSPGAWTLLFIPHLETSFLFYKRGKGLLWPRSQEVAWWSVSQEA